MAKKVRIRKKRKKSNTKPSGRGFAFNFVPGLSLFVNACIHSDNYGKLGQAMADPIRYWYTVSKVVRPLHTRPPFSLSVQGPRQKRHHTEQPCKPTLNSARSPGNGSVPYHIFGSSSSQKNEAQTGLGKGISSLVLLLVR